MNNAVNFELYDEVMLITLDRPKANAIDAETSHMLGEVFIRFRDDDNLRVAFLFLRLPWESFQIVAAS